MTKNWKLILGVLVTYSLSHANYNLLLSRKPIVCYGPDNQSVIYDVSKGLKYSVEGESRGFSKPLAAPKTNNASYLILESPYVTLQISNQGDFFKVKGDDHFTKAECELLKQI